MAFRNNTCIMNQKFNFLFMVGLIFLVVGSVNAVGITKFYYTGQPLKINAGASVSIPVALFMASQETKDSNLVIEMVNNAGIAYLVDSEIKVPAGSIDKQINLRFNVDKEIPENTQYIVDLRVKDNTVSAESGMVGFNSVKMVSFPVIVTGFEKPSSNLWIWILGIIILIVILIVLFFIWKRRKDNKDS